MKNQIVNPMAFTDLQLAAMVEDVNALKNDPDIALQHEITVEQWRFRQVALDAMASLAKLDEAERLNRRTLERKFSVGRDRTMCLPEQETKKSKALMFGAAGLLAVAVVAAVIIL